MDKHTGGRGMNNASRNTDPLSSHAAEREVTESGERQRQADIVLAAIEAHPGKTSKELTAHCGLDRYQIARRANDLYQQSKVERVENGTNELKWYIKNPEPEIVKECRMIIEGYPEGHNQIPKIQAQIDAKMRKC